MVGLVAVVVIGLVLPGISQCPVCVDRDQLVKALENQFVALTASTEDLLDFERAVFWSDGGPRQIAYIPPDPASGLWDRMQQLKDGETVEVPFNSEGEEVLTVPATLDLVDPTPCGKPQFSVEIIDHRGGESPFARSLSEALSPGGICLVIRIRGEAIAGIHLEMTN